METSYFIETVTPIIQEWGRGEIRALAIELLLTAFFVFKIYPWVMNLWDRITGR